MINDDSLKADDEEAESEEHCTNLQIQIGDQEDSRFQQNAETEMQHLIQSI